MVSTLDLTALAAALSIFVGLGIACTPTPSEEPALEKVTPREETPALPPEVPAPVEAAEVTAEPEAIQPETTGATPLSFDPLTAREAKIRITKVHRRNWTACGIIHTVGAIEVEVLDVGEPPPKLALILSCPGDLGRTLRLEEGVILQVTLHRKRQPWPRPTVAPDPGLPVRHVRSLELPEPSLEPGSARGP